MACAGKNTVALHRHRSVLQGAIFAFAGSASVFRHSHHIPPVEHKQRKRVFTYVRMQESGLSPVLEAEAAPLTVLAPTNKGLAIEQLGDVEEVCALVSADEFLQQQLPESVPGHSTLHPGTCCCLRNYMLSCR